MIGATLKPWHFRAMHVVAEGVCVTGGLLWGPKGGMSFCRARG